MSGPDVRRRHGGDTPRLVTGIDRYHAEFASGANHWRSAPEHCFTRVPNLM
jgi:hypothetical protein